MRLGLAVRLILSWLAKAEEKHPWPNDPVHGAAILAEETGEAVQAILNMVYSGGSLAAAEEELAHSGAMAVRNLMNLDKNLGVQQSNPNDIITQLCNLAQGETHDNSLVMEAVYMLARQDLLIEKMQEEILRLMQELVTKHPDCVFVKGPEGASQEE